jgi:hypothetical protein
MLRKRHDAQSFHKLYNEHTEPLPYDSTAPLMLSYHEPWTQRLADGWKLFWRAVIRKINQLLNLLLVTLILLLAARFVLVLFGITTSMFTQWVYELSGPLVLPFDNIVPTILYSGYHIEVSTLIAVMIYCIIRLILSGFLRILIS